MFDTLLRQRVEAGAVIFREGEAGDCAYVIEEGAVEILVPRAEPEVVLAYLRAGDLFGEMALIDDSARSATARATATSTLIVIRREQVLRKVDAADPLIRLFLRVVLQRLRRTSSLVSGNGQVQPGSAGDDLDDTAFRLLREQAIGMLDREQRLEDGLDHGEFDVYFQPIVELDTGCAVGFEAVLRWCQPDGTLIGPTAFVGLAEEVGLIGRLTRVVLERACAAVSPLQRAVALACPALPAPFVSINLSAMELAGITVVKDILGVLDRTGIDPEHLQVEVTESALMVDPARSARVLHALKSHGISVGVDDFGTGYSSLSYLQRLPIDELKIDRSFVAALRENAGSRKIVRAVSLLARELGLTTVAEGVERADQLQIVRECGCDRAQGYLFAPPLPVTEAATAAERRFVAPRPRAVRA